jgi:hypothetical protein
MKKLMSILATVLMAASFFVAPVNAIEKNKMLEDQIVYGNACANVGTVTPETIIRCGGQN